jgi:hypothetical protein
MRKPERISRIITLTEDASTASNVRGRLIPPDVLFSDPNEEGEGDHADTPF